MTSEPGAPAGDPAAVLARDLPDELVREAVDFAVCVARARRHGDGEGPAAPVRLAQLGARRPLSKRALSEARQLLEDAADFRVHVASKANRTMVGSVGMAWLERPDGWHQAVQPVADTPRSGVLAVEVAVSEASARAERRLRGAEQARDRANAEAADLRAQVSELRARLGELEQARDELLARVERSERERGLEHERLREAKQRAKTARAERAAALEQVVRLRARLADAEQVRDRVLAERTADLAESDRRSRAPTAEVVGGRRVPRPAREPLKIPGGLHGSSVEVAAHLVRAPGVLLLVDGYNVAKLGWPNLMLSDQRERLLDALEALVARHGTQVLVVFDAADVPRGVDGRVVAAPRRYLRVEFSPPGVIADEVIVQRVAALPVERPVVVATDDREIMGHVQRRGANLISSQQLLDVALR